MKWIKKISLTVGLLAFILFLIFGVEYNAGYKLPESNECKFPNGHKKVYVHWVKVLNNTTSIYCDGTTTPIHYDSDTKYACNCE